MAIKVTTGTTNVKTIRLNSNTIVKQITVGTPISRTTTIGSTLLSLTDVNITSLQNGQTLVYNSASNSWINDSSLLQLDSDISLLTLKIASNDFDIVTLKSQVDSNHADIIALEASIVNYRPAIDSNHADIVANALLIDSADTKLSIVQTSIINYQPSIDSNHADILTLQNVSMIAIN